ncbi:MAG: hypothetical protein VX341_08350 [Bdellovibrionota bacterium]|nr:hypothetical protein [Bdellovibrionota bacterium]
MKRMNMIFLVLLVSQLSHASDRLDKLVGEYKCKKESSFLKKEYFKLEVEKKDRGTFGGQSGSFEYSFDFFYEKKYRFKDDQKKHLTHMTFPEERLEDILDENPYKVFMFYKGRTPDAFECVFTGLFGGCERIPDKTLTVNLDNDGEVDSFSFQRDEEILDCKVE